MSQSASSSLESAIILQIQSRGAGKVYLPRIASWLFRYALYSDDFIHNAYIVHCNIMYIIGRWNFLVVMQQYTTTNLISYLNWEHPFLQLLV